jgi:hypothetical protein|tara:strand:- start:1920 stop:2078 length:159 start_codon:yes stop_codon:yes gene_type:complete
MACPKPKIERPKNKNSTDNKGGWNDSGVGALQNRVGTLLNDNILEMVFTCAN